MNAASCAENIAALVQTLKGFQPGRPLDKYIASATFPNFKNLEPSTHIEFRFPVTALVGGNGSGKSSVLHALWGMPKGYSTSRFWFSTGLDPIEEGGPHGLNRYFYQHWVTPLKRLVETKKVRGRKRLGYWEPARASKLDGMEVMPPWDSKSAPYRSKDRWNPVERDVLYINFKCEFSAFDRFFYFAPKSGSLDSIQETVQAQAQRLRRVINGNRQTYKLGGRETIGENRTLNAAELKWVSYILGRSYLGATYVLHSLYGRMLAPSVLFTQENLTYSEAFAGSGEVAVVSAVMKVLAAERYALVLLDEPETSLHPGAQERFLQFALEQVKVKHLQVVMSTHSPAIVKHLPREAIKVLEQGPAGRMRVIPDATPQTAFNRLGDTPSTILVVAEDELLRKLIEIARSLLDPGEQQAIDIVVPPGGASAILTYQIPVLMQDPRPVRVILDGDQRPYPPLPNVREISEAEKQALPHVVKDSLKVEPKTFEHDVLGFYEKYVQWFTANVRFLEAVCPEYVLLESYIGEEEARKMAQTNLEAKSALVERLESEGKDSSAEALQAYASWLLDRSSARKNRYILSLAKVLREFLAPAQP